MAPGPAGRRRPRPAAGAPRSSPAPPPTRAAHPPGGGGPGAAGPGGGAPAGPGEGESMSDTQTITVPHLGTSEIGHRFARPYDASLPTLVLVNSFTTSTDLYRPQFADDELTAAANLLAIEPYGHGRTRAGYAQFTYWDTALAGLQVLEALGIGEAFVLGPAHAGWVAARVALVR